METLLRVEHLQKKFPIKKGLFSKISGYVHAVNDVSFSLQERSTLGIVGESGCGKTTVGKSLMGIISADQGKIIFNGKTILDSKNNIRMNNNELNLMRKDIQMVFQDPYACLDPRMSILEIVTEGIKKHLDLSKKQRAEEAEKLLLKVGLNPASIYKYPHQFSGGQRQRIGIARALSLNPKLIICDEPTAALDVSIQSQILNLMLELKETSRLSYLFISHNLAVVRYFCDKIAVMYCGEIVEMTSSEELFSRTMHPYSIDLLSSVPQFEHQRARNKVLIKGEIPSTTNLPKGCLFHPRCRFADGKCKKDHPNLREVERDHLVACHHTERTRNEY